MMVSLGLFKSVLRAGLFNGKVGIVTGGATGIGMAITDELVSLGCKVVVASRKQERLIEYADTKNRIAGNTMVHPIQCNIRKEEEVQNLMEQTVKELGRIDFLVNNGGGQFMSLTADIKAKGWHAVVETNLTGTFYCMKHAYKTYMAQHGGSIVNIIVDIYKGFPGMAHSGAARAGVENLAKTLSVEWAENGIRINNVAPGIIYSPTATANYGGEGREYFDQNIHRIPAKRIGETSEVSGVVAFLLSPAASYVSGNTIYIDGAQHLYNSTYTVPDHTNYETPYDPITGTNTPPKSKL